MYVFPLVINKYTYLFNAQNELYAIGIHIHGDQGNILNSKSDEKIAVILFLEILFNALYLAKLIYLVLPSIEHLCS